MARLLKLLLPLCIFCTPFASTSHATGNSGHTTRTNIYPLEDMSEDHMTCHIAMMTAIGDFQIELPRNMRCTTLIQNGVQRFEETSSFEPWGGLVYQCHETFPDGKTARAPFQACQEAVESYSHTSSTHVYKPGYPPLLLKNISTMPLSMLNLLYSGGNALETIVHIAELAELVNAQRKGNITSSLLIRGLLSFDAGWLVYEIGKHIGHALNINLDMKPNSVGATVEMLSAGYETPRSSVKFVQYIWEFLTQLPIHTWGLLTASFKLIVYITVWINSFVTLTSSIHNDLYIVQLVRYAYNTAAPVPGYLYQWLTAPAEGNTTHYINDTYHDTLKSNPASTDDALKVAHPQAFLLFSETTH
jgi:hypothetical protein